jgi:GNAT superfamily N-acetyltransferase
MDPIELRPAHVADVEAIAQVWHDAWGDGHTGNVPAALLPYRTLAHFLTRVPPRIASTTVATSAARVLGFVTVHDDELEQIFVAKQARGTAAAALLLRHGEALIAQRFQVAWLAVVAGNDRALRFYEREGWHDAGPIDYAAEIKGGALHIPTRRYEKHVAK